MMTDADNAPWLTVVGWGESGTAGLTPASREALQAAEVVFGARRHLGLLPALAAEVREWPVPFADGIPELLAERGRRTVMLASGDPFWFGAGATLARYLDPDEWRSLPSPSTFSLAASRLGWSLEGVTCLGLHARPLTRLRPHLHRGRRLLVLLRDAEAVTALANWLGDIGFGASRLHVLEALGGDRERYRRLVADTELPDDIAHPVAVGLEVDGQGPSLPLTPGRPDDWFAHDGQITKQAVRAATLAALAPVPGERLWDIGTGSGSVAIEWLLAHPDNRALGLECDPERAERARYNARELGVDWLEVVEGDAVALLTESPASGTGVRESSPPDAVFIGGGLSRALLDALWPRLPAGARLVANAVTLESEALLADRQRELGGELVRLALSTATALGSRRGWKAAYPIVQWRIVK